MSKHDLQPVFFRSGAAILAGLQVFAGLPQPAFAQDAKSVDPPTTSPIKHVIVIIGENRTFDHIFATYKPKGGEQIDNLLSRHIIKADGTPGKNYSAAVQDTAVDTSADAHQ